MFYCVQLLFEVSMLIMVDNRMCACVLVGTERFTHSPDVDHADSIVALSSLDSLGLIVSASKDGDVRVWTVESELVRYAAYGHIVPSRGKPDSRKWASIVLTCIDSVRLVPPGHFCDWQVFMEATSSFGSHFLFVFVFGQSVYLCHSLCVRFHADFYYKVELCVLSLFCSMALACVWRYCSRSLL